MAKPDSPIDVLIEKFEEHIKLQDVMIKTHEAIITNYEVLEKNNEKIIELKNKAILRLEGFILASLPYLRIIIQSSLSFEKLSKEKREEASKLLEEWEKRLKTEERKRANAQSSMTDDPHDKDSLHKKQKKTASPSDRLIA